MFNKEEFRNFVESKIVNLYNVKGSLTKEQILTAICQFDCNINEYLKLKPANCSLKLHRIFDLSNKPRNVSINYWFLYIFGFNRCYKCQKILLISDFCTINRFWNKINKECKSCNKISKLNRNKIRDKEY